MWRATERATVCATRAVEGQVFSSPGSKDGPPAKRRKEDLLRVNAPPPPPSALLRSVGCFVELKQYKIYTFICHLFSFGFGFSFFNLFDKKESGDGARR
jgi:hypothetical protein